MRFLEDQRRQQADDPRVAAGAGEDPLREQLVDDLPRRPRGAQAEQEPLPLDGVDRPTRQVSRISRESVRTRASSPSDSIVSITASISAQARGRRRRCSRGPPTEPRRHRVARPPAPAGKPPASPLAVVSRSGVTPQACAANGWPVRPMPHCTSSRISRAPAARVSSRAAARYSAPRPTAPASPWIGSAISAATSPSRQRRLQRRRGPPRGTKVTLERGAREAVPPFPTCGSTAAAAAVPPWNPPSSATTRLLPAVPAGEAQGVLVRLGAAVDQEGAGQAGRPEAHQPLGRPGAHGERHRIALEEQFLGLRPPAPPPAADAR